MFNNIALNDEKKYLQKYFIKLEFSYNNLRFQVCERTMSTFKQKNVIKRYKLRLQEKLKTVTEETENATAFLNNCVAEVNNYLKKKFF